MIETIIPTFLSTVKDVLPIIVLLFFFQYVVLKKPVKNLKKAIVGFTYVVVGLSLFLIGLERALFPLGEVMATQLTAPGFISSSLDSVPSWTDYYWVYIFAAAIGLSTTIAEPSLIAVSIKAKEMSGGAIGSWGLRLAVAFGVALSIALGAFRIVTGTPLHYYMMVGYLVVIFQTFFAPKWLVPLAYDSGGVTTSTVTVPLVTALGLGLASTVPGRSVLIDGFGLIALASLFPMITVMGYAQLSGLLEKIRKKNSKEKF
ncbi:MAG: DUF1538 domain-containing protein [Alphaproteobacteria bacterium]|nr:DUF1538 domain-containing protein [Alphaproteobacteria bacterium]